MAIDINVYVNGANRRNILLEDSLSVEWILGARSTCNFVMVDRFSQLNGSNLPAVGQSVRVQQAGTDIFGGTIDEVTREHRLEDGRLGRFSIRSVGYEQRMDKRVVGPLSYGVTFCRASAVADTLTVDDGSVPWFNDDPVYYVGDAGGLTSNQLYYVVNRTSSNLQLALTPGGAAVDITSIGTDSRLYYCAGKIARSAMVEDITAGTIQPGSKVELATFEKIRASELADQMASLSGYVWYVDAAKHFHFTQRAANVAPFNISESGTSDALDAGFNIRKTREQYSNKTWVKCSPKSIGPSILSFTGNGSRKRFYAGFPIVDLISVTVAGSAATFGVYGVDTGKDWYYIPGDHWLIQDAAATATANGTTILIAYDSLGLTFVSNEDAGAVAERASVEAGTSGTYERVEDRSDIVSLEAGGDYAASVTNLYSQVPDQVRYSTRRAGLAPGQLQTITAATWGISGQYLIEQISATLEAVTYATPGDPERKFIFSVSAISTVRLGGFLDTFRSFVGGGSSSGGTVAGGGGTASSGAPAVIETYLLTDPSTAINSAIRSPGNFLWLLVEQDGTGGRQVAWGSNFPDQPEIQTLPGEITRLLFIAESDGKWHLVPSMA